MAQRHRAPLRYRAEVAACDDAIDKLGRYIGWCTWAANNSPMPPLRDAISLTAAQRADRTRRRAGGERQPRTARTVVKHDRSPLLGGHSLQRRGDECLLGAQQTQVADGA